MTAAQTRQPAHEAEESRRRAKEWAAKRVRAIALEVRLKTIREDGARRVAEIYRQARELRGLEEQISLTTHQSRWSTAKYTSKRDGTGIPLTLARRQHRIRVEGSNTVEAGLEASVAKWRAHVDALARELQATVAYDATAGTNAYAWYTSKRVETQPILSPESYAIALHELGHIAHACEKSHRRVPVPDDPLNKTVCVRCELNAWRFAMARALDWTRRMHDEMSVALPTYRKYATAGERADVDSFTSAVGFRRIQLQRLTGVQHA
jgi:hypothetical protein